MAKTASGADVVLEEVTGARAAVSVDKVLVVTGRTPNTDAIGLDNIGISADRGFIPVGDYGETVVPHVYAIGDVVATPQLAHVASKEGEIAAERIAGHAPRPNIDPDTVPSAVYCEPQLAGFGPTERSVKVRGIAYEKALFPYRGIGKAVAADASDGFVKLLAEPGGRRLIAAHLVGAQATELVHELLLVKSAGLHLDAVATMIHAHPTLAEGVMEAARAIGGWAIHA
jgi:dihydrolipoamide dehydrogenase